MNTNGVHHILCYYTMNSQLLKLGLIGVSLYLVSTGLSYGAFAAFAPSAPKQIPNNTNQVPEKPQARFTLDPSIPRTEPCPINGMMYTKQEQEGWAKRRPLAVMIENSVDARPQSGLSRADVVYEAIAEGGITRFMGVFYCGISAYSMSLAPIRSARMYYLPWVLEYDALYNHVGGAGNCDDPTVDDRAKALCRIDQWNIKDMDQFGLPFKLALPDGKKISVCYRNENRLGREVAPEHTMVCETEGLYQFAEQKLGLTNVDAKKVSWDKNFKSWKFTEESAVANTQGKSQTITYAASESRAEQYGVKWVFNAEKNSYDRFTGGESHTDLETEEQLSPKTVIIQFAKFQTLPNPAEVNHGHSYYENMGTGDALIFQDGAVVKGKWTKKDRSARTVFTDEKGKEWIFNRGQIWIDMLPTGTTVTY